MTSVIVRGRVVRGFEPLAYSPEGLVTTETFLLLPLSACDITHNGLSGSVYSDLLERPLIAARDVIRNKLCHTLVSVTRTYMLSLCMTTSTQQCIDTQNYSHLSSSHPERNITQQDDSQISKKTKARPNVVHSTARTLYHNIDLRLNDRHHTTPTARRTLTPDL